MRLTSIDYLLKPVAEEDLLSAVSKAVNQYRQQANAKLETQQANYWKESELYLWELFWLDLSEGAVSNRKEDIISELNLRNLNPAAADLSYLVLLIQCNGMDKLPVEKDLHEFLLKNIVREYFYNREEIPVAVRQSRQFYFLPLPEAGRSREALLSRCGQALTDFVPRFPNTFNFYIAASGCRISDFQETLKGLQDAAIKMYPGKIMYLTLHNTRMRRPQDPMWTLPQNAGATCCCPVKSGIFCLKRICS